MLHNFPRVCLVPARFVVLYWNLFRQNYCSTQIVYAIMNRDIRHAYAELLRILLESCCCCKRPRPEDARDRSVAKNSASSEGKPSAAPPLPLSYDRVPLRRRLSEAVAPSPHRKLAAVFVRSRTQSISGRGRFIGLRHELATSIAECLPPVPTHAESPTFVRQRSNTIASPPSTPAAESSPPSNPF